MTRRRASPRASPRVGAEWARRVGVEYASAALTHHLVLWLLQAGVSPDLLRLGLRIVDDELAHAELAAAVAREAGARPVALDRATLALAHDPARPLEEEIVRVCLGNFCLAETAAVRIFRVLREECSVPVARAALDRVLRDEVRHRDFGWLLLGWLLDGPHGARLRAHAQALLPSLAAEVGATYVAPDAEAREDFAAIPAADRAWGLQPLSAYRDALRLCATRDLRPRFAALGLDLEVSW